MTEPRSAYEPIVLPDCDVAPGVTGGRVVRDGYMRGAGLELGGVYPRLQADPLFQEALEASGGRSIVQAGRLANLFLLLTLYFKDVGGDVVEFGSYRGGSALFMAAVCRRLHPGARVFALDTFAGMPDCDGALDAHHGGDFHDSDLAGLQARRDALGLDNLEIVPGLFQDTFPGLAAPGRFGLAHIDADIYSACKYAEQAVWPCMRTGGYVVFDDATASTCIGATQVVEELIVARGIHSEQVHPHFVFRAGL